MNNYTGYFYRQDEEWELEPNTGAAVLAAVRRSKASAAGMDGWRPQELRCMSAKAAELVAQASSSAS